MMQFEWEPEKAKRNSKKHGVSFEEAVTVFYDPLSATFDGPDHSVNEQRCITIGLSSQERLQGNNTRIISARIATTHERKKHER